MKQRARASVVLALSRLALAYALPCCAAPTESPQVMLPEVTTRRAAPLARPGPPLGGKRAFHAGTPLADGRTLIVGGTDLIQIASAGSLLVESVSTAEAYVPATHSFVEVSPMNETRLLHSATLLADGRVLVLGGTIGFFPGRHTAEDYDAKLDRWTYVHPSQSVHAGHTATLLSTGEVLAVAGYTANQAELYDPSTDAWRYAPSLTVSRLLSTATLLSGPSGDRVLVTGGAPDFVKDAHSTAELYVRGDRSGVGQWMAIPPMNFCRIGHTATLLLDGRVLVVGGATNFAGNELSRLDTAEIYDPVKNTWTVVKQPASPRSFHAASRLTSGNVIVVGGSAHAIVDASHLSTSEIYDVTTDTWHPGNALISARSAAFPIAVGTDVLIVGGFREQPLATTELLVERPLGAACLTDTDCESSACSDRVCCSAPCTGACEACNASGACLPITGQPRVGHASCDDGLTCGVRSAETTADGCLTKCASPADCVKGYVCEAERCLPDNVAKCAPDLRSSIAGNGVSVSCGAYLCDFELGTCPGICETTSDCAVGYICNLADNVCRASGPSGVSSGCTIGATEPIEPLIAPLCVLAVLQIAARRRRRAR